MKTFYFNFEDGLEQKYIDWAKEAVQDFINLFPEYKNNFATDEKNISYDDLEILQKLAAHNKQVYEERKRTGQSTEDFDEASFWQMFEKLPDGSYKASFEKQIALATRNGMIDIQKLSRLQADSAGNMYSASTPIFVNITKQKAQGNIRGISGELGLNVSAGTCANLGYTGEDLKNYFKDIIIHELGHTFNATHEERQNAVDNLGWHCKDKNCLMYEYAYTNESFKRRKKLKEPFCADCMTSMRDFMQNRLHFTKTKENQTLYVNQGNDNQKTTENEPNAVVDPSFKKTLREIFQPSAAKQKAEYKEDIKAAEYSAEIKHANGSIDTIVAKSANNITLSAKDKDGNPRMPNMQRFRDIVALAQKQGSAIEFGNIKSPDFKARLMLACMEAKPAMKMIGAPELNDAFLQTIQDEKLKGALQIMKNKLQTQEQSKPQQNQQEATPAPEPKTQSTAETKPQPEPQPQQPTPAPEQTPTLIPQNDYERSRETRRKSLEAKEKLGKISKMEKAELEQIYFEIKRAEALEDAKKRTNNSIDPRSAEHEKESGFKAECYSNHPQRNEFLNGWKLHLDVVPNRNHPTTKSLSEMLEQLDIKHKIARGGQNGKGMTIYVGSYADTLRLSKEINSRFGKEIAVPPIYTDQKDEEYDFNKIVTGRFFMQEVYSTQYPIGKVKGICPAIATNDSSFKEQKSEGWIFSLAQKYNIIPTGDSLRDYSLILGNKKDFHKSYLFHNLEAYCSHKLYEKELGEYYCGKDADKFEKDFLGDKIPEKGTPERANWDKVAESFVNIIENEYPNTIQKMKQKSQNYKPVDFSKLPPMPQNTQVRGGGRSA